MTISQPCCRCVRNADCAAVAVLVIASFVTEPEYINLVPTRTPVDLSGVFYCHKKARILAGFFCIRDIASGNFGTADLGIKRNRSTFNVSRRSGRAAIRQLDRQKPARQCSLCSLAKRAPVRNYPLHSKVRYDRKC